MNDDFEEEYNTIMQKIADYNPEKENTDYSTAVVNIKEIANFGLDQENRPIYRIKIK